MRSTTTQSAIPMILALLLIVSPPMFAQAPTFSWAASAGGAGSDRGLGITTDTNGNIYVTGLFENAVTFGTITLTSNGSADIYVVKYNATGLVQWAVAGGGTGHDFGHSIAVDLNGNCYITGSFEGSATMGNITLGGGSSVDVFVAKYDTNGVQQWAVSGGGQGYDLGYSIAVDGIGNSYITGSFETSATFGNNTVSSNGGLGGDVFVVKYDAAGIAQWAVRGGGTATDFGNSIAVDNLGNSYVTGSFFGNATFGSTTLSSFSSDVFVAKYSPAGVVQWAVKGGGAGSTGLGIAIDNTGNSYVTGWFEGSASFGNFTLSNTGYSDAFTAKYNASGVVQWAVKGGGGAYDGGRAIAVDGNGNSYITGYFFGTATFGSSTLTSNGHFDLFAVRYNTAGVMQWARKAGGILYDDGHGIAVDNNGNIYITGFFAGSATYGSTTLTSNGDHDMFVARLGTINGLTEEQKNTLNIFPNPFHTSFSVTNTGTEPAEAILIDIMGREVHRQPLAISAGSNTVQITPDINLQPGIYILRMQQGLEVRQVRLIKQY